jgi:hypothetical protein
MAEEGHDVTFYQPIAAKKTHPKVKEFCPKTVIEKTSSGGSMNFLNNRLAEGYWGNTRISFKLPSLAFFFCETLLNSPEIAELMDNAQFDLVVIDSLFNECAYGLAYKWGAKTVIYGTTSVMEWWPDAFGFPAETSSMSQLLAGFSFPMTFGQRVVNTLIPIYAHLVRQWSYYPALEQILKAKLNIPDMPPLAELERNTSLILMSTHFSEEAARSLPPLVVPVGGIHCQNGTGQTIPKVFGIGAFRHCFYTNENTCHKIIDWFLACLATIASYVNDWTDLTENE